jgi:hypothetical protein
LAAVLRTARPLRRWLNWIVVALYPRGLGWLVGNWVLVLTTTGRHTGAQRQTPLGYISIGGDECPVFGVPSPHCPTPNTHHGMPEMLLVFRAAPVGADWLANVRAQPDVDVLVGRQRLTARAEVLRDPAARHAALAASLRSRTPPARALRRRFGLDLRRPQPGVTRAVADPRCILVALRPRHD